MTPLELAQYYLDCYYKTGDFKAIRNILADDLQFNGPFQHFESAASYVNALANNPPKNVAYKMIKSYCDETSACLVYQFLKPGVSTPMNQTFWVGTYPGLTNEHLEYIANTLETFFDLNF